MNYNLSNKISDIYVSEDNCIEAINKFVDNRKIDLKGDMVYKIPHLDKILINFKNRDYIGKLIFHGGCLNCYTPIVASIGICINCKYYDFNLNKPDLSINSF